MPLKVIFSPHEPSATGLPMTSYQATLWRTMAKEAAVAADQVGGPGGAARDVVDGRAIHGDGRTGRGMDRDEGIRERTRRSQLGARAVQLNLSVAASSGVGWAE